MTHTAGLLFTYKTPKVASLVERSVRQETGEIESERTTASVSRDGTDLTVSIEAEDLIALRAGLNTWNTLIEVAEQAAVVQ